MVPPFLNLSIPKVYNNPFNITAKKIMKRQRKITTIFDDYYDMMSDEVRMSAYNKAIRRVVKPGDVVLDLGAGVGILTFLALKAGAKKVYAIEKMDSIHLAQAVAKKNGLENRIEFINENSKLVELPEKVDLLLSETLGTFALEENTLDFTIDARKRFLKEGGAMVPERIKLFLAPIQSEKMDQRASYWKDVYGVDYSPAYETMLGKLLIEDISSQDFLAKPEMLADIDLRTCDSPLVGGELAFPIQEKGTVHGLGGWFEVWLTKDIFINTSPDRKRTHWKQGYFPFSNPIQVGNLDKLSVKMTVGPRTKDEDDASLSYDYYCTQLGDSEPENTQPIGRNDPCSCGSGKKYKKCCGR